MSDAAAPLLAGFGKLPAKGDFIRIGAHVPELTALDDGRVLAVWYDLGNQDDTNMDIRGQFVNADGTLSGSEFLIAPGLPVEGENDRDLPVLSAEKLADGNVIVGYASGDHVVFDVDDSAP